MEFSVSSSQLIKLIKSVTSFVFEKVTTIVCVFLRKAPAKKSLDYTCDNFFPGDNFLVSARKSHSSGVRSLVVRCLLFNPEGSCTNPCVCANFFTSIPKQKVLTFFGTMRLPPSPVLSDAGVDNQLLGFQLIAIIGSN